jgi:hypothetical protein
MTLERVRRVAKGGAGSVCPARSKDANYVTLRIIPIVATCVLVAACGSARADKPAPEPVLIWRPVGSWSGHGNAQTESFTSDTGALRVHWETHAAAGAPDPGASFRLTAHSAISGRPLQQVVEHRGAGDGVGYVSQDPHVFYMAVESSHLDWKFSVEEGIAGQVTGRSTR